MGQLDNNKLSVLGRLGILLYLDIVLIIGTIVNTIEIWFPIIHDWVRPLLIVLLLISYYIPGLWKNKNLPKTEKMSKTEYNLWNAFLVIYLLFVIISPGLRQFIPQTVLWENTYFFLRNYFSLFLFLLTQFYFLKKKVW